ncbi:MAG: D-erythronate dehydrogenase, partial [Shimia sp.]
HGLEAILPVGRDVTAWHASPRSAAGFLLHAAGLDSVAIGPHRALNLLGVSCSVGDQIDALREAAGADAVALIREMRDPVVEAIVGSWPRAFDPARARALGFRAESSFAEIIEVYRTDDMP